MSVPAAVAAVFALLAPLAACTEDTTGRACDVLKRREAAADPFGEIVIQDPARLRQAFADAVDTAVSLDRFAPASLRTDAAAALQAYRELEALFARVEFVATKVDVKRFGELREQLLGAEAALSRFGIGTCGIRIVDRRAP